MAYSTKERKDWLMRATPLGVGTLSKAKLEVLLELRARILPLMRTMALAGFVAEPLLGATPRRDLEDCLVALRKSDKTLNTVWKEKARTLVQPALEAGNKRYFRKLAGSLRFVDAKIPVTPALPPDEAFIGPPAPVRRYFHVPLDWQDAVTKAELDALKNIG